MKKAQTIAGFDGETVAARVAISEMTIDEYQGHVNKNLVEKIAAEWDESAAGAVILNLRESDQYAVLDGQHRYLAAKKAGVKDLNALVFIGKTREEEAKLFVQLNTKHNMQAMDRFKANLFSGATRETAIRNVVEGVGLLITSDGANPKAVRSVVALTELYENFGLNHLAKVLGALKDIFGAYDDPIAFSDAAIRGMSALLYRYPEVDMNRLIAKLTKHSPRTIQGMASARMGVGRSSWLCWGEVMTNLYNHGVRTDSAYYLPTDRWEKAVYSPKGLVAQKKKGAALKNAAHLKQYQFKPGVPRHEQINMQRTLSKAAKQAK
jgi:hypothetical protein